MTEAAEERLLRDLNDETAWKPLPRIDYGNSFTIYLGRISINDNLLTDIQTRYYST